MTLLLSSIPPERRLACFCDTKCEHKVDFLEELFLSNGPFRPVKSILCHLLKAFKDPHKVIL